MKGSEILRLLAIMKFPFSVPNANGPLKTVTLKDESNISLHKALIRYKVNTVLTFYLERHSWLCGIFRYLKFGAFLVCFFIQDRISLCSST